MAIERSANFSDEVTQGCSVRAEEEFVEREGWIYSWDSRAVPNLLRLTDHLINFVSVRRPPLNIIPQFPLALCG